MIPQTSLNRKGRGRKQNQASSVQNYKDHFKYFRVKRDMNPLYLVGDVADWTFGR